MSTESKFNEVRCPWNQLSTGSNFHGIICLVLDYRKSSNKTRPPIIPEFLIIPAFSTILLH